MNYSRQNFVDGQTLYASHLNHIEDGIVQLASEVETPNGGSTGGTTSLTIGTVTSGSVASASIVNNQLNLVLPKGDTGAVGPQGPKGPKGDTGPAATLDPTLSVSGNAADAKATGDAVSQLREDLDVIANLPDITEIGHRHEGVAGNKKISVVQDARFASNPNIYYGKNYWPNMKYWSRDMPFKGLTIASEDGSTVEVSGTSDEKISTEFYVLLEEGGSQYIPLDDTGLAVGDALRFHLFYSQMNYSFPPAVQFFDADKNRLLHVAIIPTADKGYLSRLCVVPENTAYVCFRFGWSDKGAAFNEALCPVLVKADVESETYAFAEDGTCDFESTNGSDVVTLAPHPGTVEHLMHLKAYIDKRASNQAPLDLEAIRKEYNFITPEMFGAYGDDKHDDTDALNACFQYAKDRECIIIGGGIYKTSGTLVVDTNRLQAYVKRINCNADCAALAICGMQNTITVSYIYSVGNAVEFRSTQNVTTSNNRLDIRGIWANGNGIVFRNMDEDSKWVMQTTVTFSYIHAGGSEKYGILYEDNIGVSENNFFGGQITNCHYAFRGRGGNSKFYSIHVEGNVDGGFWFRGDCIASIYGDRHAESANTGNDAFIKFDLPDGGYLDGSDGSRLALLYDNNIGLSIDMIDISNVPLVKSIDGETFSPLLETECGRIRAPIRLARYYREDLGEMFHPPGVLSNDGAIIWGNRFIFKPTGIRKSTITEEVVDLRDTNSLRKPLSTDFEIECTCTIYLHASYHYLGYNQFRVQQKNGCTATIIDVNGCTAFDGTELGDGLFEVTHVVDDDESYFGMVLIDGKGKKWVYRKID